jgi:formyltetrahydrofolate deformylase
MTTSMIERTPSYILTLSCPDGIGIVAAVTNNLAQHCALVTEAQHFREPVSNSSILRIVFESGGAVPINIEHWARDFTKVAERFCMMWKIRAAATRKRVLVAVSKQGHCLKSLLHRWEVGTLPVDIVGVVSNHETQRRLVEWQGLPFHYLPIEPYGQAAQEQQMLSLFRELNADLLVLARYMQILSSELCRELAGRAINIHHSFLPGFKGARPYHQAYARGVKLIGATAHYVNDDLDEGSIIEQAVERVDHTLEAEQLTTLGNEIESIVLNRAIQWHSEDRIFEFGNRTIILR